ncbi:MAG: hypothetical protein JWR63_2743, partial [Conexibacter sp.]|nr:hypothetical protein [Conexibacter sp.]
METVHPSPSSEIPMKRSILIVP